MPREDYVRPPLVPTEPPSRQLALWRYRVVAGVALLVLLVLLLWLVLHFAGVRSGEDPGLIGAPVSPAAAP